MRLARPRGLPNWTTCLGKNKPFEFNLSICALYSAPLRMTYANGPF